MDIGMTNDNFTFYEGYEGEPEIVLSLPSNTVQVFDLMVAFFKKAIASGVSVKVEKA